MHPSLKRNEKNNQVAPSLIFLTSYQKLIGRFENNFSQMIEKEDFDSL